MNTKVEDEQCFVSERLPKQQQSVGCKRKRGSTAKERISQIPPCAAGKRSSIYRGVTRHRWTGRFEAHLWDKGTWNHAQNKKGKQVYLGAYDDEEAAARAYDLAALKYWGPGTVINFPVTDYSRDIDEMQHVTREEYLASLRRKSSGGGSKCRAVSSGRLDAGGRLLGNKFVCLSTTDAEYKGLKSVTVFDLSRFLPWLRPGQGGSNNSGDSNTAEAHNSDEFVDEIFHGDANQGETRGWNFQAAEPYQLPLLGLHSSSFKKKRKLFTALGLVVQSSMFQQMLSKSCSSSARHGQLDQQELQQQKYVDVDGGGEWYRSNDGAVYTASHLEQLLPSSSQKGEEEDGSSLSLWSTAFTSSLLRVHPVVLA